MEAQVATIELTIDGIKVAGSPEETVLQVARRHDIYIPTLCQHDDLGSEGRCRLCLVEIEGFRGLTTACTTKVAQGMEVRTDSPEIEKNRRMIVELLLSDHPADCTSCAANLNCELQTVAAYLGIDRVRFRRTERGLPIDESNPFFVRDMSKCILCGRCVQTCGDLQGVGAIDFMARGYDTVVGTYRDLPILETICESCGECVVRCPTGALAKRERRRPTKQVRSVCPYCATGCGLVLGIRGGRIVSVEGDSLSPVNRGALCVKGRFAFDFVHSPERLTAPLIKRGGEFVEATWDQALALVASKFSQYKGDSFAAVGPARATNEENYLVQKFARAVMATNNVDNCARL
jgi:predicted molibdopterin-dependent oxidoreductase YjgC